MPFSRYSLNALEHERRHLLAVAFRLLGSESEAQDIVQEVWIRYAHADLNDVRNVPAWLTTVVTRLCLDAFRRRREIPLSEEAVHQPADARTNPEEVAVLASELTDAFTMLLDVLTPPQRVALILHDVFGTPFDQIAHVLETTPDSAKKLASRARLRIRHHDNESTVPAPAAQRVVTEFLRAAQLGDVDGLVALLHPNVTRTADPQVLPPSGRQRIRGIRAVVSEAQGFQAMARRARVVSINKRPAIAVEINGRLRTALLFTITDDRIVHYDVVADPERLAVLRIQH
jgi:RNA polymerase sigma factor (sigma-70 family)